MWLGINDFWVFLAYFLCLISALLCLIYGWKNWNKGHINEEDYKKESEWALKEKNIEETF
jgi:TRAP-type C4-dicarboxylate transport system permease small subunit